MWCPNGVGYHTVLLKALASNRLTSNLAEGAWTESEQVSATTYTDLIGVEVFERAAGVQGETTVVDPEIAIGIGFQLVESSSENPSASTLIAAREVVEAHGDLNKALIEEFLLSVGLSPEILPDFMGLEIASTIKIFYSVLESVRHGPIFSNTFILCGLG